MTALILAPNQPLPKYDDMCRAISECHEIDDCVHIADRASAVAAYCKQLHDTENEKKLKEIKLRAWRQVAKLICEIDVSGCTSYAQKTKKIRVELTDETNKLLTDSRIYEMLRLGEVSDEKFEELLPDARGIPSYLIQAANAPPPPTPEEIAARNSAWKLHQEEIAKRQQADQRKAESAEMEASEAILKEARAIGVAEVPAGLTMHPKFKKEQKWLSIAMPIEVHEQLRQAAFDNHMTMWAVIRQALDAWFVSRGYKSIGEIVPQDRVTKGTSRPGGFGGGR